VVDDLVAGPGAVDADQYVGPVLGRDLRERRTQHCDVVGGGVRPGVAGPVHDRQVVLDVGAPRTEGMEPEPALVGPGRAFLVRLRLDRRGVQPTATFNPRDHSTAPAARLSARPRRAVRLPARAAARLVLTR